MGRNKGWCSWCAKAVDMGHKHEKDLTTKPTYYILEIDTLIEELAYDDPHQPGLKAYSVIKIDESGAHEVDRAYRSVREALEAWPEAIPPASSWVMTTAQLNALGT